MGKQAQKLDESYPTTELVRGTLDLPDTLDRVEKQGRTGLVLGLDHTHQLSKILGRNILTADDLISACERLTTCNVEGTEVCIEPGLLIRLKSRAMRQPFSEYLTKTITRLLHGEVGW